MYFSTSPVFLFIFSANISQICLCNCGIEPFPLKDFALCLITVYEVYLVYYFLLHCTGIKMIWKLSPVEVVCQH